jgi:hypothetical protein
MFPHRQYRNDCIGALGGGVKYPPIAPITEGEFVRAKQGSDRNHPDSFKTGRQKTVDWFLKFLRKARAPFVGRK